MKKIILFYFLTISLSASAQNFSGWNRSQAITINSSLVEGTTPLTDFPILVTLDHLNEEVVDGGMNSALNGGGDIRFSSDASGNNRLAIEVVEFITDPIPTNRKCQIWVKIPSLSATSDTTIYIWYNKNGEVQPSATEVYGSQSVWSSNYVSVWHMEEDPSGTVPQIKDSGFGLNNGTTGGNMESNDLVPSQIGNGLALNGNKQFVNVGNSSNLNLVSNLTISGWVNPTNFHAFYIMAKRSETVNSGYNILFQKEEYLTFYDGTTIHYPGLKYNENQWNYAVIKIDPIGTTTMFFLNGVFSSGKTTLELTDGLAQNLYLGARSNGAGLPLNGLIDEVRVSNIERSNDWIATEYNNQINPLDFASAGASEAHMIDTETPTIPVLSNITQTNTTVDLSWTAATDDVGVVGYKVYKNTILETTLSNVLTYQVTGLTAATAYNFTVTALDAAGNESAVSNIVAITTNASSGGGSSYWSLNNQNVYYTDGNVGIGTSIPDSKLTVKGNIHSEEVKVDLSVPAPDYVFDTDYKLTPMETLQRYIKKNNHLPNIPSAKELEAHGVELGTMNMKLLKKIEEMTLYILEQQNQLDLQKSKNKTLKKRLIKLETLIKTTKK